MLLSFSSTIFQTWLSPACLYDTSMAGSLLWDLFRLSVDVSSIFRLILVPDPACDVVRPMGFLPWDYQISR